MKVILQGKDWSKINEIGGLVIGKFDNKQENNSENSVNESNEPNVVVSDQDLFSLDYFERFFSLFGHEPSAFNLGLYQTSEKDEEVLKSTKYVGIMPLLKLDRENETKRNESELSVVKISSRFGISPTDMISEVLAGNDYYENPDMLKTKIYNESEWRSLAKKIGEDKVLFGLISGIGHIDLFSGSTGSDDASETDVGLVDAYGVFEIIDFVKKAKDVCKKNLKKQSQRVEENLDCKVKGRILIQKQIKYNISKGQNQKTYCSYNKMSDDIKENQIIKYALHLCQKNHGIGDSLAEDIRFCMNTLCGVPLKKCSSADFIGLKNNGAFRQYKEALNAAKKVISRYSLSYSNQKSDDSLSAETKAQLTSGKVLPNFIDMNLLFEYYCRAIFKKAIEEINSDSEIKISFELESTRNSKRVLFPVSSDYWNKYVVSGNESDEGDEVAESHRFFMPQYIPDIVITYRTGNDNSQRVAAVFDAKYSDVEKKEKRSRTHQVLFYMKALGCDYGGLISPYMKKKGEEDVQIKETNLAINQNVSKGNPRLDMDSDMKLFYVPLISNNTTDNKDIFNKYVKLAVDCLKEIYSGLSKKIEKEQIYRDLQDMVTEEKIKLLKKKDMPNYINEIKCKIEQFNDK